MDEDSESTPPDEQEAQVSTDKSKPKKAKASVSEAPAREPGKSLLPYSRVQKILKADRVHAIALIPRTTLKLVYM